MSPNYSTASIIPPNTYVVLNIEPDSVYADYLEAYQRELGVLNGQVVLCLGEISNQPGHYICVNGTTLQVVAGFHADLFRPAEDEDL